jgi:hypothetical protein
MVSRPEMSHKIASDCCWCSGRNDGGNALVAKLESLTGIWGLKVWDHAVVKSRYGPWPSDMPVSIGIDFYEYS